MAKSHGGKRPRSGRKVETGRQRSTQKSYSVQPLTDRKIEMLADQKGISKGRVVDDLVATIINFEVSI